MSHHLQRLAFLSTHSSPLAMPGTTKAGGMNVYIDALTRRLGRSGRRVDIFTRRDDPALPTVVPLDRNVRVVNISAGPPAPLPPLDVYAVEAEFRAGVQAFVAQDAEPAGHGAPYDLIHSHYWVSAITGMALADDWRRPHVAMFHTLGEVKNRARRAEREPALRIDAERGIVARADRVICATPHEKSFLVQIYGAHADCVSVVPGGVDVDRFRPADPPHDRAQARRALGLPAEPTALFVGRLERLKGVDILVRAAALADVEPPLHLVIVGGDAADAPERARLRALAESRRASATASTSSTPSIATRWRSTTAPPTSASCPRTTRASASSRSRRWPAARPSSPPASAACSTPSATARPGTSSRGAAPSPSPSGWKRCSPTTTCAPASPPPPPPRCASSTGTSSPARSSMCTRTCSSATRPAPPRATPPDSAPAPPMTAIDCQR